MFDSQLAEKAAQFHALAGELTAALGADTSGRVAAELLPDLVAGTRLGELASCRAIERVDRSGEFAVDGAASTSAYVRQLTNESGAWASKRVTIGRALADSLPATERVWERGELGLDHAMVIHRATCKLTDPSLVAALDSFLADQAPQLDPRQLAQIAEILRSQAAPEDSAADEAAKRAAQTVSLSQTLDGMWRLDGWLDPEAGLIVSRAIAEFTRKPLAGGSLLTDSAGRRRADALVQMARHASAHAQSCNGEGGGRHTVIVGLSHEQLVDRLGAAGVDGGGVVSAAAARRMACDAGIIPAVYGGESQELDFGSRVRTLTAGLRHKLVVRDGGCVFAGCDRPPSWTEAHHRRHFVDGGATSAENLDLLCVFHHHLVHEGGWRLTIAKDEDRTPLFHPPDGRPPIPGQRRRLIPIVKNQPGRRVRHRGPEVRVRT